MCFHGKPRNATWVMLSTFTHVSDFLVRCLGGNKISYARHIRNRLATGISGQEHLIYTGPLATQQFLSFPIGFQFRKLARNPKTARLIYQIILHNSEHCWSWVASRPLLAGIPEWCRRLATLTDSFISGSIRCGHCRDWSPEFGVGIGTWKFDYNFALMMPKLE